MILKNSEDFTEDVWQQMDAGSHILYIFNEKDKYIENAISFIMNGLLKNEVILFVETKETFDQVLDQLKARDDHSIDYQKLLFVDSAETYLVGDQFHLEKTGSLIDMLNPYLDEGFSLRTWGHVLLTDDVCTVDRLRIYEHNSDQFIQKNNLVSVCAYNGLTLPAYLQNELMRIHTHFMTDREFITSPLYDKSFLEIPSIEKNEQLRKFAKENKEHRDQTNRLENEKRISEVITESQQNFQTVIEQLPYPMIIRRGTTILFINNKAREQFLNNVQKNTNYNDHLLLFFEKYDRDPVGKKQYQTHEFPLSNEKKKYYIVNSIELLYEGESSTLHSFIDISQEKENERLLIRTEKLNTAGELAAGIAHEIRNPLTAIKGFFQMIKQEGHANNFYYSVIDSELSRVEQITSELLALAKPHSENRQDLNMVQLMEEVTLLLTSEANNKSIEMTLQATKKEIYISCEETKIKQVFINLVKNAIEAMENGGQIQIKISEMDGNIVVQLIDQGFGMPKEVLEKIGEPFYTTKEKGTGIGLMVCFQIIEGHEGTIQVDSESGVGTTFTIALPLSKRPFPS
ncbi:two-component sensor histidine kinase [Halalkalibacter wakoensis JCM 9140]|uniref:histidine kinase n=1 Tax=Halalkalibacter wakoensis JCM 9140 TaxID=1236970 RepID=W4Q600_9BACI|nr:ATP-binding protein [Halalkalibacter wakoensis]GAE26804.1 two-component sensor histidine kinase [Halalkalibacter wakoensis JCM 9140]